MYILRTGPQVGCINILQNVTEWIFNTIISMANHHEYELDETIQKRSCAR